jgi:hypothetical protein
VGPHYIVCGYTRPGAILMQLLIQFVKEQQQKSGNVTIGSQQLKAFLTDLFKK